MCIFWLGSGTKVGRRYIHLSGKDLDNKLISLNSGREVAKQDYALKTKTCTRYDESLSPTSQFCGRCGLPVKLYEQYLKEIEEKENRNSEIESVRKEMNQKFDRMMELYQLAYVS